MKASRAVEALVRTEIVSGDHQEVLGAVAEGHEALRPGEHEADRSLGSAMVRRRVTSKTGEGSARAREAAWKRSPPKAGR